MKVNERKERSGAERKYFSKVALCDILDMKIDCQHQAIVAGSKIWCLGGGVPRGCGYHKSGVAVIWHERSSNVMIGVGLDVPSLASYCVHEMVGSGRTKEYIW